MAIPATRHSFGQVQAHQVASLDTVKDAPNFRVRVGMQVCRRGPAFGAAIKIEAQLVPFETTGTILPCLYAAANAKGAVVHVGAIGKVPDLLPGPAAQAACSLPGRRRPPPTSRCW